MTTWTYVLGFAFLAWVSLAAGAAIRLKAADALFGVLAVACAVIAGTYATDTWIRGLLGWIVGIHPVVSLVLFLAVLFGVVWTVRVLAMSNLIAGIPASLPIVAAWIALPSLLSLGVIPGTAGTTIGGVVDTVSTVLIANTRWFG